MHQRDRQRRLADAAQAQHTHYPAALLDRPAGEQGQFLLAPIEAGHIQRVAPIHPRLPQSRKSTDTVSATDLFVPDVHQRGCVLTEQLAQPQLIQEHLLMRCMPERPDLLGLAPGGKDSLPQTQGNEGFEMLGFGITLADLPPPDRVAGDPEMVSQSGLGQPGRHAQRQHELPEGRVLLSIRRFLHESSPFRTTTRPN